MNNDNSSPSLPKNKKNLVTVTLSNEQNEALKAVCAKLDRTQAWVIRKALEMSLGNITNS